METFGSQDASKTDEYLITTNQNKSKVIIDTYKDSFIVAEVDLASKLIYPRYKLIKISDKSDIEFQLLKTGKLEVDKTQKF